MKRTVIIFILIFVLFLSNNCQANWQLVDLGSGAAASGAYSINDSGQIVGAAYDSSNGQYACLFDASGAGSNINLGTLSVPPAAAYSINNNGQIVGYGSVSGYNPGTYTTYACEFYTDREYNSNLYNSYTSSAYCINDNGIAVGIVGSLGSPLAYLFDTNSHNSYYPLGSPEGDPVGGMWGSTKKSSANSINNSNQIVGWETDSSGKRRACLFDSSGSKNNLSLDSSLYGSYALSINNQGQIVGNVLVDTSSNTSAYSFDISGNGNNTYLGTVSGYNYSSASSVNDLGQVAGSCYITNNYGSEDYYNRCACLFDINGTLPPVDLNTLIDSNSGWSLISARDINNNGWIVGTGLYEGQERAYLLIPVPEPSLISLLGCGAIFKLRRRSKHVS